MATLQELETAEPSIRLAEIVLSMRNSMIRRGAAADADVVGRFAQYLFEYWDSTGAMDRLIASTDGMTEDQLRNM